MYCDFLMTDFKINRENEELLFSLDVKAKNQNQINFNYIVCVFSNNVNIKFSAHDAFLE